MKISSTLSRWLNIAPWQQHALLAFCLLLACYLPLFDSIQITQQWQQLDTEQAELHSKLTHQQQILTSLKQRSEQALLTPELANQLLPLNQQIQQWSSKNLHIQHSHWEFHQTPLLRLTVQGRFKNLQQFLTALLQQNSHVALLNLQISKDNELESHGMLHSELQFKLAPERTQLVQQ